jgi:hypothetical protein
MPEAGKTPGTYPGGPWQQRKMGRHRDSVRAASSRGYPFFPRPFFSAAPCSAVPDSRFADGAGLLQFIILQQLTVVVVY